MSILMYTLFMGVLSTSGYMPTGHAFASIIPDSGQKSSNVSNGIAWPPNASARSFALSVTHQNKDKWGFQLGFFYFSSVSRFRVSIVCLSGMLSMNIVLLIFVVYYLYIFLIMIFYLGFSMDMKDFNFIFFRLDFWCPAWTFILLLPLFLCLSDSKK